MGDQQVRPLRAFLVTLRSTARHEWACSLVLLAYVALLAVLRYHHEPYGDEADAWLMARDASVREILGIMGAAGTPSLWYFVQLPFAKLGFPFVTQGILNGAIATGAAAIFLFRAPFASARKVARIARTNSHN
jgi:hypothetical protein